MSSLQSLQAIAQDIIKDLSGGQISVGSTYSERQVMEKVRQARNFFIQDAWRKSKLKEFDANWTQEYRPTYDKDLQTPEYPYTVYTCPRILKLDKGAGLFWAGKLDGFTEFMCYENIGKASNFYKHKLTNTINDKYNGVVYENEQLLVFGNPSNRRLLIRAVFEEPQDITGFDAETDEYPLSGHMIPLIKDMVKKELAPTLQIPADQKNDGTAPKNK